MLGSRKTPFWPPLGDTFLHFTDCQGFNLCHRNVPCNPEPDQWVRWGSLRPEWKPLTAFQSLWDSSLSAWIPERRTRFQRKQIIYKHHNQQLNLCASAWKSAVRRYQADLHEVHLTNLTFLGCQSKFDSLLLLNTLCVVYKLHLLPQLSHMSRGYLICQGAPPCSLDSELRFSALLIVCRGPISHKPISSITTIQLRVSVTSRGSGAAAVMSPMFVRR